MGDTLITVAFLGFFAAIAFGGFTCWLAETKGRNAAAWFFLGLFFGPLALLTLGFAGDEDRDPQRVETTAVRSESGPLSIPPEMRR